MPEIGSSSDGVTIEFVKISSATAFGFEEEYFTKHIIAFDAHTLATHSLHVAQLSTLTGINSLVTSVTVLPSQSSISNDDLDLNEGTTYNISISYKDKFLNDASTIAIGLLEFSGSTTRSPILTAPAQDAPLSTSFTLSFTLPEVPLAGSVKVTFTTISGDTGTAERVITFVSGSSIENRGSHSVSITTFESASDLSVVQSVSPSTPLLDGAVYNVSISYQDSVGNPAAVTTNTISFHGSETLPVTMLSPSNSSCLKTVFNFTFILPEKALDDSLIMTMEPISGQTDNAGTRTIVFEDEYAGIRSIGSGFFQQLSGLAGLGDIKSVSPSSDLVDGTVYQITLSYQDAGNHPAAVHVLTDMTFCGDQTIDLEASGAWLLKGTFTGVVALPQNWTLGIRLPEKALPGSLQLGLARVDGPADPDSPRTIVLGSVLEAAGGQFHTNYSFIDLKDYSKPYPTEYIRDLLPSNKELIDGTVYRFVLSYQDCAGNPSNSFTRDLITYAGGSTLPPSIIVSSIVGSPIPITFVIPELAEAGSVKLTFSRTDGAEDNNGDRVIVLNSNAEAALTYSIELGAITGLSSTLSEYFASASPNIDLVDGSVYSVSITYKDAGGNPEQTATAENVLFAGSATRTPILYTPTTTQVVLETIAILFNLPEQAFASTLKLIFSDTGYGSTDNVAPHTLVLSSGFLGQGNQSFNLGALAKAQLQSEITSVTPSAGNPQDLVHMAQYNLRLEYQDLVQNPVAFAVNYNITYDVLTESIIFSTPSTQTAINTTFNLAFTLQERAMSGSLKATITYVSGITDNAAARSVVFSSNVETAGTHTISFAELSDAASLSEVATISPSTDLVDGAVYDIRLEYQDFPGNSIVTFTQSAVVFAGSATIAPTFSLPAANGKIPLQFTIQFTLPEKPKEDTLQLVFTRTSGTVDPDSPRTIKFAPSIQQVGTHSFSIGNLQSAATTSSSVDSVTPAAPLVHQTIYTLELSYLDFGSNPRGSVSHTSIEFDTVTDPPTIVLPKSQTRIKVNFQLQFTMSEAALGNTLILSITPAGGDSAGKRTLTFNSTFDSTGSHTIQLTNFSVLAASTTDVVSVSPATDLVNGVTYLFVMSMKDSVDNEEDFLPLQLQYLIHLQLNQVLLCHKQTSRSKRHFKLRIRYQKMLILALCSFYLSRKMTGKLLIQVKPV